MGLAEDLRAEVSDIFVSHWTSRNGSVVPDSDDIKLSNDGVVLDAAVIYADLADSTEMVDDRTDTFSAEVYKTFLKCCCKVITSHGGAITAFDGDRVMAVYIGDSKNTNAVKTALKINWAVKNIVNTEMKRVYQNISFEVKHGCGVDSGKLLVARTGIRGSNDLVWVGPAANYAAKLSALRTDGYSTWISKKVFDHIHREAKYDGQGNLMWESRVWNTYNQTIYRSSYWWSF